MPAQSQERNAKSFSAKWRPRSIITHEPISFGRDVETMLQVPEPLEPDRLSPVGNPRSLLPMVPLAHDVVAPASLQGEKEKAGSVHELDLGSKGFCLA